MKELAQTTTERLSTEKLNWRRRFGRTAGRAALALTCAFGAAVSVQIDVTPASANETHTVYDTLGQGVWLHETPGLKTTDLKTLMPEGAEFEVECWTKSDSVEGNDVWDVGTYHSPNGPIHGAVTDRYLNTEWRAADLIRNDVPECEKSISREEYNPEINNTPHYNRQAAAQWAIQHSEDKPPFDGACTWFVSQALWQGGLEKTAKWTNSGNHGYPKWIGGSGERPGTVAATAVANFKDFLLREYPNSTWRELDFSINPVPQAAPGDVIFYDWGRGEGISHATIIVNIADESYPEVAEWSAIEDNTLIPTPYIKRGWTWSEISRKWLQEKYPNVKAYLFHIDPIVDSPYANIG